jgi:hypothetical protein
VTRFEAPWDRQLLLGSAILGSVMAALAAGVLALGLALSRGDLELLWPFLVGPVLIALVVAGAWLLAPRGFAIEGRDLVVLRPIRPVRIPLQEIRAVEPLPPEAVAFALRVGGNGGMFGYYGQFWNRRLGSFRMYATRRSGLVRVGTGREVFVLSPGDPEAFVDALLARAPGARRGASDGPAASMRPAARRVLRALGIGMAGVALLVGVLFAGIWGFAPVAAEVAGRSVWVERRWASAVEIPLAGIHSAEVMAPQHGRRWARTGGTAMGPIRYGRFASRELGPFRLFAWRLGPYVLLETDQGRVVLTPDEPERFVATIRERLEAR